MDGATHGPPQVEKPLQLERQISMRRFAASATAKATVSTHSSVLNLTGPGGMPTLTSKIVAPPMPTAAIASRSATIPSRVTLPFIQCHQTCGRAAGGGERKAERSWSSPAAPTAAVAQTRHSAVIVCFMYTPRFVQSVTPFLKILKMTTPRLFYCDYYSTNHREMGYFPAK